MVSPSTSGNYTLNLKNYLIAIFKIENGDH